MMVLLRNAIHSRNVPKGGKLSSFLPDCQTPGHSPSPTILLSEGDHQASAPPRLSGKVVEEAEGESAQLQVEIVPHTYTLAFIAQLGHGFWAKKGTDFVEFKKTLPLLFSASSLFLQLLCSVSLSPQFFNLTDRMRIQTDVSLTENSRQQIWEVSRAQNNSGTLFNLTKLVALFLLGMNLLPDITQRGQNLLLYWYFPKSDREGRVWYCVSFLFSALAFLLVPPFLIVGSIGLILMSDTAQDVMLNCIASVFVTEIDNLIVFFYFEANGLEREDFWTLRRPLAPTEGLATRQDELGGIGVSESFREVGGGGGEEAIKSLREQRMKRRVQDVGSLIGTFGAAFCVPLCVVPFLTTRINDLNEARGLFLVELVLIYLGVYGLLTCEILPSSVLRSLAVQFPSLRKPDADEILGFARLSLISLSGALFVSALGVFVISGFEGYRTLSPLTATVVVVPIATFLLLAFAFGFLLRMRRFRSLRVFSWFRGTGGVRGFKETVSLGSTEVHSSKRLYALTRLQGYLPAATEGITRMQVWPSKQSPFEREDWDTLTSFLGSFKASFLEQLSFQDVDLSDEEIAMELFETLREPLSRLTFQSSHICTRALRVLRRPAGPSLKALCLSDVNLSNETTLADLFEALPSSLTTLELDVNQDQLPLPSSSSWTVLESRLRLGGGGGACVESEEQTGGHVGGASEEESLRAAEEFGLPLLTFFSCRRASSSVPEAVTSLLRGRRRGHFARMQSYLVTESPGYVNFRRSKERAGLESNRGSKENAETRVVTHRLE